MRHLENIKEQHSCFPFDWAQSGGGSQRVDQTLSQEQTEFVDEQTHVDDVEESVSESDDENMETGL